MEKKPFQKLLGSWIFPVMFLREAFAVYHHVFKDLQLLPERKRGQLSNNSRDELFVMMVLGPLLRHNLRWPVSQTPYALDAEGNGGSAIVEAPIS